MHRGSRSELASVLIDIEAALRQLGHWDAEAPSAAALASDQPFAVDTLSLPQWLQFIFLPRIYALLDVGGELPSRCGIAPMCEEYFRGSKQPVDGLLESLEAVDRLLSDEEPVYTLSKS